MAARMVLIGADTGNGYEHFTADLRPDGKDARVCILRGAIGTGRHLILERLAQDWERRGRAVTRYADAGDGGRLAAIVSGGWAALDGAAPHPAEAMPGDLEIDCGDALDREALLEQRAEAWTLLRRMHALRARAWRCLRGAHTAWSDSAAVYAEAADGGNMMNLRLELIRWMQGSPGGRQRAFARAVTPDGMTETADGLTRPHILHLELPWDCDPDAVLYPVAAALRLNGIGHTAIMQPLDGGRLEGLCTDTHALTVLPRPGCETRAPRFDPEVLRRERAALDFNRAAYHLWQSQAAGALAAVRDCRERLERLVGDALIPEKQEELARLAADWFK